MESGPDEKFALLAEVDGNTKPLIGFNLSLARLFDDVVVPYQSEEPFFIDGVPVTRAKIKRLKIMKQGPDFDSALSQFNRTLTRSGSIDFRKVYGEQYHTRVEALLRVNTEDVTSQIIKAFDTAIKPGLKDYLPNREELISSASKFFWEGIKLLG